jgi:uncharacterized protein YbaA (DUF1428 family)
MAGYVDLYLLPVPKKHLKAYRGMANLFGKVVRAHGATEYREFVASGAKPMPGCKGVEQILEPKKGEVMVFSVVGFKSKKHRDRVNQKVYEDTRMQKMMEKKPIFDMKRMYLSEFETFVGFKNR